LQIHNKSIFYLRGRYTHYTLVCFHCLTNVHHSIFAFNRTYFVILALILESIFLVSNLKLRILSRKCHMILLTIYNLKISYSYVKYNNFKMIITHFKMIISIKAYSIAYIIFLALNLIIGKFTLILKLTSQNVFCWTQICYDVSVGQRHYIICAE
jgi:hypothetical protein